MRFILLWLTVICMLISCSTEKTIVTTDQDLIVANVDGDNAEVLFYNIPERSIVPEYNYDRSKIILGNRYGLWMCDSDGSALQRIASDYWLDDGYFSVSPVDNTVLFICDSEVIEYNISTGDIMNLTPDIPDEYAYASYSPDGDYIVFCSSTYNFGYLNKIYIMEDDGSNVYVIYSEESSSDQIESPVFTNDMSKIIFRKFHSGLYIWDFEHLEITPVSTDDGYITFTTGGGNIAFTESGVVKVYNMNTQEIYNIAVGYHPKISKDGSKLLYTKSNSVGNSYLYVSNVDGSNNMKIERVASRCYSLSNNADEILYLKVNEYISH